MRNWKEIPIPPKMLSNQKDDRGYPIPYIVLFDRNRKPLFTVNDERKVKKCIAERKCGICGKLLENDVWFVGGAQAAFHEDGAYIDSPVHHECGTYALQVCPYLAIPNYTHKVATGKLAERVDGRILVDPTVDPNRPVFFGFVRTTNFSIVANGYLIPVKPYIGVEFWNNGAKITRDEAKILAKDLKIHF